MNIWIVFMSVAHFFHESCSAVKIILVASCLPISFILLILLVVFKPSSLMIFAERCYFWVDISSLHTHSGNFKNVGNIENVSVVHVEEV